MARARYALFEAPPSVFASSFLLRLCVTAAPSSPKNPIDTAFSPTGPPYPKADPIDQMGKANAQETPDPLGARSFHGASYVALRPHRAPCLRWLAHAPTAGVGISAPASKAGLDWSPPLA